MKLRLWLALCWLMAATSWFIDLQVIPDVPEASGCVQQTEWMLLFPV